MVKHIIKSIVMYLRHPSFLFMRNRIGKNCYVGRRLEMNTPKFFNLGDNVRIGHDARLAFYNNFAGKVNQPSLEIGDRAYIGNHFTVLCADRIRIGEDALIASYVMISSENHGNDPESELVYGKQPLKTNPVTIGSGVWIGEKVSILPGVTIGEKSIIGTNSVVTSDVPPYSIAVGSPAKVIKEYDKTTKKWKRVYGG